MPKDMEWQPFYLSLDCYLLLDDLTKFIERIVFFEQ